MNNQVIPDAAVEAAAKCLPGYDPYWSGDEADRAENEALRARAHQMLEAAAPQMLADAWDEGYSSGAREERPGWTKNPYRPTP